MGGRRPRYRHLALAAGQLPTTELITSRRSWLRQFLNTLRFPNSTAALSALARTALLLSSGREESVVTVYSFEDEERVQQAWAARTYGEIEALTADLPQAQSPAVRVTRESAIPWAPTQPGRTTPSDQPAPGNR